MNPVVYVDKLKYGEEEINNQLLKAFSHVSLIDQFNQARAVFIKPNLTYPYYKEGVTTRRDFVLALVKALRQINSSTIIYIGEGEGGNNSFSMTEAMRVMGYYEIEKMYPAVKIINLSEIPSKEVELTVKNGPYPIDLPAIFFDEIDFSITCPVPKVHCMTGLTLAYKNQWGCLPDIMRLKNHYVFDQIICQVCDQLKFKYAFLDGMYGLDDNGPMDGIPIKVDWFVASNSLGAHDLVVSKLMEWEWTKVGHLVEAQKQGYLYEEKNIAIIGDISGLKRHFQLNRNFWNYPALVAFHSKWLTQLVYLSRFSDAIHDLMYTFRKRPIE